MNNVIYLYGHTCVEERMKYSELVKRFRFYFIFDQKC